MKNSFSTFFLDHSNLFSKSFIQSSFKNFLKTPIIVEKSDLLFARKTFTSSQYSDNDKLTVIGCIFKNCEQTNGYGENDYRRGGAIRVVSNGKNSDVTIYSSSFENCKTMKGDGGAIFVCKEQATSGFDSSHGLVNLFNSSYCCYSKCSAYGTDKQGEAGYGPVMFIFAKTIEIFYSTAVECPVDNSDSYGAQFDLKSDTIRSSYINSTKGKSKYCCAMEYRQATGGHFKFQTFIQLEGGYLTSFTDLSQDLDISYCNYIKDTINPTSNEQNSNGAFIYVRSCNVHVSNFCFVEITINGGFDFVHFDGDNSKSIVLENSFMESGIADKLKGVTTKNISFYNGGNKYTNEIELLGLGPCEGEVEPPPTEFSKTFKPTEYFSHSSEFSESKKFSETNEFSETGEFSNTQKFSESKKFNPTKMFSESEVFSASNNLPDKSKSNKFSNSIDFTESKKFSESSVFSDSNYLPNKAKTSPFTESQKFSKSKNFTPSFKFTESQVFKPTKVFSKSNSFLASMIMIDRDSNLQETKNDKKLSTGAIAGIVIGSVAAAAGIIIAAFFIVRMIKKNSIITEDIGMKDIDNSSISTTNPIYGQGADDPFKEDFDD